MSSSQQAVIALINRSTVLLGELNRTRRANRELEQRLDQALARIAELEEGAPPVIAARAPLIAGPSTLAAAPLLMTGPSAHAADAPLADPLSSAAGASFMS